MSNWITFLFICLSIPTFAQQRSLGVSFSTAVGFINLAETNTRKAFPLVPDVELSYIRYETKKISWKTGLGLSLHTFHNQYENVVDETQYMDKVMHLTIPYHLNYHPKPWIYVGGGINTNLKIQAVTYASYPNNIYGPSMENRQPGRDVLIEGLINGGLEFNVKNIKGRIGAFYEMPINNREYFNIGSELSLLYTI